MTRTFLVILSMACLAGCGSIPATPPETPRPPPIITRTIHVQLPSGTTDVDLYFTDVPHPLPLVVVAHGFSRGRNNMSGWGRKLAEEGFIAAVPDLPAWSDHARNGRFINELIDYLTASASAVPPIDRQRVGLIGFSAGGLATLLAAAENPSIGVWVGLDPVDRNGQGISAAAKLRCRAAILRAEPSACNAYGNAAAIQQALTIPGLFLSIPNATHSDPEWPTDWKAELACGKSSETRRAIFVENAMKALHPLAGTLR